jgi:hypothetical protein
MRDFYDMSKERLESTLNATEIWLANAKADVVKYEEQLKAVTDALKNFSAEKVEEVADKVEEVVEVVKEEVKKAAPKKATSKKAAKAEETPAEEPETDK